MISTYVKRSIGEERYDWKQSRTVLKRGLGGDSYSYFNQSFSIMVCLKPFFGQWLAKNLLVLVFLAFLDR